MRLAFVLLTSCSLAGCATTSFAPPNVDLKNQLEVTGGTASGGCRTAIKPTTAITPGTAAGARALIDNFIYVYRCRAHEAANGRQAFELPAFLALIGATTAVAFGAGPDVAIAGGAANSVFKGGQAYYDPKQKAEIFDHALDALICIKMEAVGIDAYDIITYDKAHNYALTLGDQGGPQVSATQQYYDLVASSLFSVERVLAHRLSNTGTFDPAGVVAEINALQKQIDDKKGGGAAGSGGAGQATGNGPPSGTQPLGAAVDTQRFGEALKALGVDPTRSDSIRLDIKDLRPKLEKCVVRAKI